MNTAQISAYISTETKISVENYLKKSGIKKRFLIEEALLHYLQALKEIPHDLIIPSRIKITDNSMKQLLALLKNTDEPTDELKDLMRHV